MGKPRIVEADRFPALVGRSLRDRRPCGHGKRRKRLRLLRCIGGGSRFPSLPMSGKVRKPRGKCSSYLFSRDVGLNDYGETVIVSGHSRRQKVNEERKVNPFYGPIETIVGKIRGIIWRMPFLPQIIQFLVQSFILFVLCILYCTIGIVFNCYAVFCSLLVETRKEFRCSDLVGKSAYALMAGIYLLLAAPCWVIVMPFMLLGWFWERMSWFGLVGYCLLVGAVVTIAFDYNGLLSFWLDLFCR